MAELEGTIRFRYALHTPAPEDLVPRELLSMLESWRCVFERLALIGRDHDRYGGYAYGNLSVRDPASPDRFFITASQTADLPLTDAAAVPRIDACDIESFRVSATGTRAPSSESVTHAMVYLADRHIDWLFHVHSPSIWHHSNTLGLAAIAPDIPYGSAALAQAVRVLLCERTERPLVFATLGHEDGVFACGADPDELGAALVIALAHALALEAGTDRP